MKLLLLVTIVFLCLAASASAQGGPRPFDNFDTSRGVEVQSAPKVNAVKRAPLRHYLPSPQHGEKFKNQVAAGPLDTEVVKKIAQVTMNVSEGFAEREAVLIVPAESVMMGSGSHLKGFSTGDDMVDAFIVDSSRRYGIDPLLIYAQMSQESSFKRMAKSHKGASGLMQLMPATARRLGVTNIYDPKQNIEGGVKYMRMLLNMFNQDVILALAGYNAGEGAVMKYGGRVPPYNETRDYVRRISTRYKAISNQIAARIPIPTRFVKPQLSTHPSTQVPTVRLTDGRVRLIN